MMEQQRRASAEALPRSRANSGMPVMPPDVQTTDTVFSPTVETAALSADGSSTPDQHSSSRAGTRAHSPEDWDPEVTPSTLTTLVGRPETPADSPPAPVPPDDDAPPAPDVGMAVEGIRLGGRHMAVETMYTIELPSMPDDFAVDVELSNGLTVVVPHPPNHVDGRWATVAKDAPNGKQLVARFTRHASMPMHQYALRMLGSPFAGDVSALLVLLLATLTVLTDPDAEGGTSANATSVFGRISQRASRRTPRDPSLPPSLPDAFTHLLAALYGVPAASVATVDLLSAALLSALLLALCARLLGRLSERFPPTSAYTLCLQSRAGLAIVDDAPSARRGWLSRKRPASKLFEEGGSPLVTLQRVFTACIIDAPAGSKTMI